jgi:hypothetical protein
MISDDVRCRDVEKCVMSVRVNHRVFTIKLNTQEDSQEVLKLQNPLLIFGNMVVVYAIQICHGWKEIVQSDYFEVEKSRFLENCC